MSAYVHGSGRHDLVRATCSAAKNRWDTARPVRVGDADESWLSDDRELGVGVSGWWKELSHDPDGKVHDATFDEVVSAARKEGHAIGLNRPGVCANCLLLATPLHLAVHQVLALLRQEGVLFRDAWREWLGDPRCLVLR